jgi:hypothetical protein
MNCAIGRPLAAAFLRCAVLLQRLCAPTSAGVLLASALALAATAAPAATYLDVNLTSIHQRQGWKEQGRLVAFNDRNFGVGLTHEVRRSLEVKVGFYQNSFYKTSGYVLANFIYHQRLGAVTVAPAFGVGLISGYRGTSCCDVTDGRSDVEPAVFPNLSLGIAAARLNIGTIPRLKGDMDVFTFQFEFKLPD